jgi:hypothetical protein
MKVTHNLQNGVYQSSDLRLVFKDGSHDFIIRTREGVDTLLETMRQFDQRIRVAAQEQDWDYFMGNDEFRGVLTHVPERPRRDQIRKVSYGGSIGSGVLLLLIAFLINADPGYQVDPGRRTFPEKIAVRPSPLDTVLHLGSTPEPAFTEPRQPLPENGAVDRHRSGRPLAPLEVRTRGTEHHFYVKVVDWATDEPVATLFVRAGQAAEMLLPLGTYRLRYATGAVWYGEAQLFGPETAYNEAEHRFSFRESADGYSGYTVELFLQRDGNLPTKRIPADRF